MSGEDKEALEAAIVRAAEAWLNARTACVSMPVADPNWRTLLNDLSNAEDNLAKAVRAYH